MPEISRSGARACRRPVASEVIEPELGDGEFYAVGGAAVNGDAVHPRRDGHGRSAFDRLVVRDAVAGDEFNGERGDGEDFGGLVRTRAR